MAVKIIDETPDPKIVKRISCTNCGVRLEYLPVDVKKYRGTDYGGGPNGRDWINCPKCNQMITIDSW